MKKFSILLALLALTACNQVTSETDLICDFSPSSIYGKELPVTQVSLNIKTYANYAEVTFNEKTERFAQIKSEEYEPQQFAVEYQGILPEINQEVKMNLAVNTKDNLVLQYSIAFVADTQYLFYTCTPVKPEHQGTEWSAKVPYKG